MPSDSRTEHSEHLDARSGEDMDGNQTWLDVRHDGFYGRRKVLAKTGADADMKLRSADMKLRRKCGKPAMDASAFRPSLQAPIFFYILDIGFGKIPFRYSL